MTNQEIIQKVRQFLKDYNLTVIATVDMQNNKPECATIAFGEKEDLSLVFGTSNTSRKYKNLQNNQNVSFVFGWSADTGTVQYEGKARELSGDEALQHAEVMILKNKQTEKFITRADQRYFLVTPTWIRFLDVSPGTAGVYEIDL